MSRAVLKVLLIGVLAAAAVPALWLLGLASLPSYSATIAAGVGDTLGVWAFTWALIGVAMAAALVIAGIACSWLIEARRPHPVIERAG